MNCHLCKQKMTHVKEDEKTVTYDCDTDGCPVYSITFYKKYLGAKKDE